MSAQIQVYYDIATRRLVRDNGQPDTRQIKIAYQEMPQIQVSFVTADPVAGTITPVDVSTTGSLATSAWYAAVSNNFTHSNPMARVLSADIINSGATSGVIIVKLSATHANWKTAVGVLQEVPGWFELRGTNDFMYINFYCRFPIICENIIDPFTGVTFPPLDS